MSTLDDLRSSLAAHAPAEDSAVLDRAGAVRSRVRVVRRRRRLSAVVGAVAAVAVVAAGVSLPRLLDDRRDPDVAATTVIVGGFEYRRVRTVESRPGQRSLEVTVPREDADQAFSLVASGLGSGTATLRPVYDTAQDHAAPGMTIDAITGDGVNPPLPLPTYFDDASPDLHYLLTVEGGDSGTTVGVAFYERTARMPDGVVDPTGTTVFRGEVGSRSLLAAAFADPGDAEVTFTFTGRRDQVALEEFCAFGAGSDRSDGPAYVNLSVDGAQFALGECGDPAEDAGSGSLRSDDAGAGEHEVRVWTSATAGGAPRAFDGLVLGGAAYDDSDAVTIDGSRVDPVVEFDGRTWELDRTASRRSVLDGNSVTLSLTVDRPVLLGYAADGASRLDVSVDGNVVNSDGGLDDRSATSGPVSSLGTVVLPPDEATYTLTWPWTDKEVVASVLVYRLRG